MQNSRTVRQYCFRRFAAIGLLLAFGLMTALFAQQRSRANQSDLFSSQITMDHSGKAATGIRFATGKQPTVAGFFDQYRQYFHLSGDNELRSYQVFTDRLGQTHHRMQQYYKGVEVIGAQYVLHEQNGHVVYANGRLIHHIALDVIPVLSESAALNAALAHVNAAAYMWEDPDNEAFIRREQNDPNATFYPKGELKITAGRGEMVAENCRLVYRFDIYAREPLGRYYVDVDARTGQIVNQLDRIHDVDVAGSGASLYNGTVNMTVDEVAANSYRLQEHTIRTADIETFDMQNGTNYLSAVDFTSTAATGPWDNAGVSAHFGAEATFDYYLNSHGRNSLDNAGFALRSYVHYDVGFVNAFWDGQRMTYGDGDGVSFFPLVSLDVVSHELTHGVTEFSANLIYQDESGALNESFSDIFGNLVEFEVEGAPGVGTGSWRMGEDIMATGQGIRNMENPNEFSDPDTYFGTFWAPLGGPDNGGVHTNSGVQNFWFYLLASGGSGTNDNGDAYNVTGIGLVDAAAIAYRNLTVYLTASATYLDARTGSINAATDLFGAASQQVQSVKDAWDAVGVYEPVPPEGILVYEGQLGGANYSGAYINNYLSSAGFLTQYTAIFPPSLIGFDAVFLSFGNFGTDGSTYTAFNTTMAAAVQAYLEAGGKVYLEGGDALGFDQGANTPLHNLLGLSDAADGSSTSTPITALTGQTGALTAGMQFNGSSQPNNNWVDIYTVGAGQLAFVEPTLGNVGVQYSGVNGQKTLCFSYALGLLTDGASPSTRDDLMAAVLAFMELAGGGTADITVTPAALNETLTPGGTSVQTFDIGNIGDANLTFTITPVDGAPLGGTVRHGEKMHRDSAFGNAPLRTPVAKSRAVKPVDERFGSRTRTESRGSAGVTIRRISRGTPIFTDNMDGDNTVTGLQNRGYVVSNQSVPLGITDWFQGNSAVFGAFNGPDTGYVAANFNNTTGVGTIDNWLILPALDIQAGDELSFYSRSVLNSIFPDSLRVMYNPTGATSPFDPNWVELDRFQVITDGTWELRTLSAPSDGSTARFALRYHVTGGGPSGSNSNYIGIDAITVNDVTTPPPTTCPWLTAITPGSGTVTPGGTNTISVTFDATGLAVGTYQCELHISSNDPDENPVVVPVTLNVVESSEKQVIGSVNCPAQVPNGGTFTAEIEVDMSDADLPPDDLLGSFTATLSWDPAKLTYVADSGILSGFIGNVVVDAVNGLISFNGVNAGGVGGIVDLLNVTFEYNCLQGELSTIDLEFSAMAAAGTFADLLPFLTTVDCTVECVECKLGDVNGDGLCNSSDALLILSADVGIDVPPDVTDRIALGCGDVNGDGNTDSGDALIILSFDVGISVPYPVCQ